jgi:valyl-tRNA synthetase
LEDKWILSLLNQTNREINKNLDEYTFDKAATRAYEFFWNDFCATYVELAKPVLFGKIGTPALRANKQKLLVILLSNAIRLMHPISPFITEEIFSLLKGHFPDLKKIKADPYTQETIEALLTPACIVAPYPKLIEERDIDLKIEQQFNFMNELVRSVRNIRAEMQLPPSEKTELLIMGEEFDVNILLALTPTSRVSFITQAPKTRLEKEREKLEKLLESTKVKLANEEFRSRAPKEVVEKLEQAQAQTERQLSEISDKLRRI